MTSQTEIAPHSAEVLSLIRALIFFTWLLCCWSVCCNNDIPAAPVPSPSLLGSADSLLRVCSSAVGAETGFSPLLKLSSPRFTRTHMEYTHTADILNSSYPSTRRQSGRTNSSDWFNTSWQTARSTNCRSQSANKGGIFWIITNPTAATVDLREQWSDRPQCGAV